MPIVTLTAGSFIVPMETAHQDRGMFKAYGLVNRLLAEKIPVMWVIRPGKPYGGIDFVAAAADFATGDPIPSHAYSGGPFAIDARDAAAAAPIIQAWQRTNPVTVHVTTVDAEVPVSATLVRPPRIAVAHPFADHIFAYLNAAGIPDSESQPWSSASLDALSPADVAHGALFDFDSGPARQPAYDVLLVPPAPDEVWADPEALAELDAFVQQGGHLQAHGHAISLLENRLFFLTIEGIPTFGNRGLSGTFTVDEPDQGLVQAVPAVRPQALPVPNPFRPFPSTRTWLRNQPGLTYRPGTQVMTHFRDKSGAPFDFMITGPYKGAAGAGRVSYMGGGAFATSLPYSDNSEAPYVRCLLNALLLSVARAEQAALTGSEEATHCRLLGCCGNADDPTAQQPECGPAPVPVITKSPSAVTVPGGAEVTWVLTTANTGINTLFNPVIIDTLPSGFTFGSAMPAPTSVEPGPGGTTVVTWTAPAIPSAIPAGQGPTISLTATATSAIGTFINVATLTGVDLLGISHSASTTASVTVLGGAPTVEIIAPPAGSTICGTVTLSANAFSPVGIHDVTFAFSLDGGLTWVTIGTDTSGPPFTVAFDTLTVPDGPILIRAVATANNGLTATAVNEYVVDNTPPVVAITAPPNNATVSGTITVTGTATDNIAVAFVEWLVDGILVETQTTPPFELTIDTTQLANGPHTVTLRACDFCPNCASTSITIIVENVPPPPPTVEIIAPPAGSTICGTVTIVANASSPVGIHDVTFAFSLDGGLTWVTIGTDTSGPPFTVAFDTLTVPDGPLLVRAVATANNGLTATAVNEYVVDNTPPQVAITAPPNDATVSGTITVTGTAVDNIALAFVEWLVDGTVVETQNAPPFAVTIDTTQLTNGSHTVTLRACDRCPNCASTSITIIVENVPPTPPTVEIIAPPAGSTICGTVTIVANASSPVGIHDVAFAFSLNGGLTWVPIGTDTSGPPFSVAFDTTAVPDGPILVRAVATANNGLTATAVNEYVVDNTPPEVAITLPPNGSLVSGTITVRGVAVDNIGLSLVEWLVDGTVVETQSSPPFELTIDTTLLSEGPHTVTLRACDFCPNCTSASITIIVENVPPPPPTVEIISPPNGATICGTVTIVANAASPAGIHDVAFAFSLNGGLTWVPIGTDTSGPPFSVAFDTTAVPDGPILVRAVATANNGLMATAINEYVVDNTPPVVAITSPPNNSVVSGTITVTGTATDNIALAFVEWLIDGTVVETQTAPPFTLTIDTTQLSEGPHTITLRACDRCPNCASASITIIVRNVVPPPPQRQVGVDHAIRIPRRKPEAEAILTHREEITVERVHVIGTPLGTKVIVTGRVCVLVTYVADVRDQSVHAVEECFPFSTFLLAPDLAPNAALDVTTALEFADFKLLDPRTISKFIVFNVIATPL